MKNKFVFFANFKETADKLPDDLRLNFYDAMTDYVFKGVEPSNIVISALIAAIKPSLDVEDKRGGLREGAGRKSKIIKNNQKNQIDYFDKNENQNNSSVIKNNQKQKTKITPFITPEENKNIYIPPTSKDVTPPLPEKDDKTIDIEEFIARSKRKKFTPPSLDDVKAYVADKGLTIDPQTFYDYFCEGKWTDSEGKPVKNWKQKALTWDSKERQRRTIAAARGLIPQKSGVVSATYGKDIPL